MTLFKTLSNLGNNSKLSSSSSKINLSTSSLVQGTNNISCGGQGPIVYTGPSGRGYTLEELIAIGIQHTNQYLSGQMPTLPGGC